MAFVEIHGTLTRHRKVLRLSVLMGIHRCQAIGHLVSLWNWAVDNAPDGDLTNLDDAMIAIGADWDGNGADFVDALVQSGLLDREDSTLHIHDWEEYAGRLIANRDRYNADRRNKRMKEKVEFVAPETQPINPGEVRRRFTLADVERIYGQYPRKIDKAAGVKEIQDAVRRILSGKDRPDFLPPDAPWPPQDAAIWLEERVKLFAQAVHGSVDPKFILYPARFFKRARYSDHESTYTQLSDAEPARRPNGRAGAATPGLFDTGVTQTRAIRGGIEQ